MSELYLRTAQRNGQTIIEDQSFTAPLKIAKPFYRDTHTEVMLMCASPGLLEGDRYHMRLEMGDNTRTAITTQSYQKLFRTQTGFSAQDLDIAVGERAALAYLPLPVIPFAGSRFVGRTDVGLKRTSKLFFCDIVQAGRVGELYAFSEYSSRVRISIEGRPVFLDHTRLAPAEAAVEGIGFFEGHACQGFLYLYGFDPPNLPECMHLQHACSKAREGYSIRILGNSGDGLHRFARALFSECFPGQK
ncbi:MAG TPA: urease accessory protein UreD [Clostridia bacterium]|nr:urease accessory protein UreD [Clostridia bacterium]